jgi:23S rRNA-/tRNA-specific pseudouridylate synthase
VVGDDRYGFEDPDRALGQKGYRRMMLHASRLEIPSLEGHPAVQIDAPLDDEMRHLWHEVMQGQNK